MNTSTETKAKHTQGPWRIGDAGTTVFGPPNGNPSPLRIADIAKTPEYRANARLIAAAPELLEALRAALAYNDSVASPDGTGQFSWGPQARAALAKAQSTFRLPRRLLGHPGRRGGSLAA